MRSRSSAVPRVRSGGTGGAPTSSRSNAAIATGKVARISAGVLSSGRLASARRTPSINDRPRACGNQSAQPLERPLAPGAEPGAHRVAVEPVAGESLPQQPDRAVIAEARDEIRQGIAAHPQDAARPVAVAQHRLGGDKPGETAVERLAFRAFHAHSAASGAVETAVSRSTSRCSSNAQAWTSANGCLP